MTEYHAGDAKLQIIPDATGFKKDLESKLAAMKVDFTVKVNVAVAQAKADLVRFRTEEAEKTIGQRVSPQFTRARTELAAFRAEERANAINIPVNVDTSQLREATKAARAVGDGAAASAGGVEKLGSALAQVGKSVAFTGLIANIPAAVTGIFSLTQAIGQLSGAALAIPGAIAVAGASIGTLALGLSGISDAYTAVSAAQDSSVTHSTALTTATNNEVQAQKDVAQARKDATQQLKDLNLEQRGGVISVAQAENDAAKARRDLMKGGFKDALDLRDAQLRVLESDQRVAEAKSRQGDVTDKLNTANKTGVDGMPAVVSANKALVASQLAVATANGTAGTAADKAREAMAKLSPQAADFVNTLVGLKPRWEDLKKTVSGNLFAGASSSFTTFVDSVLPNLKSGMGSIATAWNSDIKQLLSSLGSGNSKGLLDRILGNTTEAQKNFQKAIDPLVTGIGTLAAAGSDAMPRIANAIGDVATRFSTFIEAADKDGRLQGWIDAGLKGFGDLGNILLNIGKSFAAVDSALGGQGLLASLKTATEKMATFLNSTDGQNKLKKFFEEGREEIDKLKPIIHNIIDILPQIWQGAKNAWETFSPILDTVTGVLKNMPDLITKVSEAFALWNAIKFTGLLSSLGGSGKGRKGSGGSGLLGKLGIAAALLAFVNSNGTDDGDDGGGDQPILDTNNSTFQAGLGAASLIPGPQQPFAVAASVGITAAQAAGDAINTRQDATVGKKLSDYDATHPYVPPVPTGGPTTGIRDKIAAGDPALAGYTIGPDGVIIDPQGNPIPGLAGGGHTKAGLAVLHDNEFVLSDRAKKYPMGFKHALNEGKVDPRSLPHYQTGGPWPPDDGHSNLGPPGTEGPASGGLGSLFSDVQSGLASTNIFSPGAALGGAGATTPSLPAGAVPPKPFVPSVTAVPAAAVPPAPGGGTSVPTPAAPAIPAADGVPHVGTGALPGPPSDVPSNAPPDVVDPAAAPPPTTGFQLPAWDAAWRGNYNAGGIQGVLDGLPDKLKPGNILKQFGSALFTGALSAIGLPGLASYFNTANTALGDVKGLGLGGQDLSYDQLAAENDDGSPRGGGVDGAGIPGGTGLLNTASQASNFGGASTTYTPAFLQSKGIAPLYTRSTDSKGNNVAQIPAWTSQLAAAFNLTPTSHVDTTLHGGAGASPGGGWAFDFSGKPEDEQRFADFIKNNLGGQTLQLIWQNPNTGEQDGIAGGQVLGKNQYYTTPGGSYADHTDHVHWATDVQPNLVDPTTGKSYLAAGSDGLAAMSQKTGTLAGQSIGGSGGLKAKAHQLYLAAGMPPEEWSDFDQLIQHESSWSPTAKNPGSTAYGLGQFLDSTWASVGGSRSSDPMQQLPLIFAYLKQRSDYHGSPAAAWSLWQSRSPHWYDKGGILPTGTTLARNDTGKPELVLTQDQIPHYLLGGAVDNFFKTAMVAPAPPPPPLPPRGPDAQMEIPPSIPLPKLPPTPAPLPASPQPASPTPAPAAQPGPPEPTPPLPPPPAPAAPDPEAPTVSPLGPTADSAVGAAPSHLHPALQKGIKSGFATAGNIAGAAASMGLGGLGGGAASSLISGAFQQAGKIAEGVANVGASMLVGSDKLGGDTGKAYGTTYHPAQIQPATGMDRSHTTNYNGGITVADPNELRRELDLRDSQQHQSVMANR